MQLHEVKIKTARKTKKRVGRGGSRGKTSGRGTKGQKARSGNSMRPHIREIIKKIPKKRGHGKNRAQSLGLQKPVAVLNVSALDSNFKSGEKVTPDSLFKKGMIRKVNGNYPRVKILGNGEIKTKVVIARCDISKEAEAKVVKAGGSVIKAKVETK